MANISKITTPDGTTYDLKVRSDHVAPIETKTYTGVYCEANNDPKGYLYFARLKPVDNDYTKQIYIKYRVKANIPYFANGSGSKESEVECRLYNSSLIWYKTMNGESNASYRPYYAHLIYRATQVGLTNGYGHQLGFGFYSSYNPHNSTYARDITIEILELENCTIEFYDAMKLYSEVDGTGSTDYVGRTEMDGTTQGDTHTGDRNDPNYQNRIYYSSRKTYTSLFRYQLLLTMQDHGYMLPVTTANSDVSTSKTMTDLEFDPFGEILYFSSTGSYAANVNIGNATMYRQGLFDFRYAFNIGGYNAAGLLVARDPVYLVATPQANGSAVLYSDPITQELPTTDDGLIYIYLGTAYEDTYPYRLELSMHHPVYQYKNGGIQLYTRDAATVDGHTIKSDVPTGAKFTDTTYTAGTGLSLSGTTFSNSGVTGVKGNVESSYRTGNVNLTPANLGAVAKTGDTMTGNLIAPSVRVANTYYGVSFGRTTATPVETILYTGIKWVNSSHMPVVHITGYAYGLASPVEFKIGFYIYNGNIGWCGVTNMGSWAPDVYLFKYTREDVNYVAIGLAGSCYFLQLQADVQDEMGKFANIVLSSDAWSWSFLTTAGTIPAHDNGVTCYKVPYKANILNPSKVNGHTVNSDVPANAVFTDTTALGSMTGTLTINHGGTGATDAASARTNLGLGSASTYTASSTVGNNSNLPTGSAVQTYVTGLGYEANQNAFSNVKVGSTTISADTKTDTLELVAGSNITLTPDATNDKVTIAATDTKYESKAAASGGTAVSLVTTGEKYTWNNKQDALTNPVTGTGTSGYLAKWDGSGTVTNGPQLGSDTTTFLRNDGTWATPSGSGGSTNGIYSVIGTQTTNTASWTGNIDVDELYDGLTIAYYLPRSSNTNVTLNLTLSDGETQTGAVPVYLTGTTRLGTHYTSGSTIILTYYSAGSISTSGTVIDTASWRHADYYAADGNTVPAAYTTGQASYSAKTATFTGYVLRSNNYFTWVINTTNTYTGAITLNVNSTGAKPLYINGSASSSSNHNLPAGTYIVYYNGSYYDISTDSYVKMNIRGTASNATNAGTVNGHTVQSDVPANAVFTDTTDLGELGIGHCVCDTAASTTAKTAIIDTWDNYVLGLGGIVSVYFANDVPASSTLNIQSMGAFPIYYRNAAITAGIICAGDTATFMYDGQYYVLLSVDRNYGNVASLSYTVVSTF